MGDQYYTDTRPGSEPARPFDSRLDRCDCELCQAYIGDDYNEYEIHHKKIAKLPVDKIIEEQYQEMKLGSGMTTTKTSTTTIITKNKVVGNNYSSGATTSTPKSNYRQETVTTHHSSGGAARRVDEVSQNNINVHLEQAQDAAAQNKSSNLSYSRLFNSASDIDNSTRDHLAYQEYRSHGEYWKTTPKTDYTYSELSPHRRELAPGIVAMPNMSRRGLEGYNERLAYYYDRDAVQEEYLRRRNFYETTETEKRTYDSADEYDTTASYIQTQVTQQRNWFIRIITTIWTKLFGINQSQSQFRSDYRTESNIYRSKYTNLNIESNRTIWTAIASAFTSLFYHIYSHFCSILNFDSWLLQSSHNDNRAKKRFFIFLFLLLPFLLLGAWYLLGENDRLYYYLQRVQTLLPLSLVASLKSTLHSSGASLLALFQLPFWSRSGSSSYSEQAAQQLHMQNIQHNMQKSLTPEEYENILNHVNSYVQQLVDIKVQQQETQRAHHITPQQTQIIVQIMRENLERLAREKRDTGGGQVAALSDAELLHLAHLVRLQLADSGWAGQSLHLSGENLAEIKKLIQEQHTEIHNHAYYTLLVDQLDLDALLARILSARQMATYVDTRINAAIERKRFSGVQQEGSGDRERAAVHERQQLLIDELNREIAFIKLALSDKLSENDDLHQSISQLRLSQDDLLKRMQQHELSTDKRFSVLLAEIESKLVALQDDQFTQLNKQIKLSLIEILGFKQLTPAGAQLTDADLQNWVRNVFVAKDYLEERLLELHNQTNEQLSAEIDRSGMLLMRDISERLKKELLLAIEVKQNESTATLKGHINTALSEAEVRRIVKTVLAIYDADKTGLVDFALESAGGQILSTRCTESYQTKTAQISVFGIPLWYPTNTPRVAISPNVQPGECWAFQGFPGFLVLKLNSLVFVSGFTLEHIPKSLAPNGRIESAPKNFTVWGLEHEKDQEPVLFGEYEYTDNEAALQYFPVQNLKVDRPYDIVELRIETNHGNAQYTCLYRFRVHGKPPAA